MMFHELSSNYPAADLALMHLERGSGWKKEWTSWIVGEVGKAITKLGLDSPWEDLAKNPVKQALADSLWSSVLACFGPELKAEDVKALNKIRFGPDYATNDVSAHVFTGNHLSVSVKLFPLDSKGSLYKGPATSHHMPTFASVAGGKPAIGDISPVKVALLPWAPGCVGGCNACDQSHGTNTVVNVAEKMGLELADIYKPIIDDLGSGYAKAYAIITGKEK